DNDEPLTTAELAEHLQIVLEDVTARTAGKDFGVLSPGTWRVAGQDIKHVMIREGLGWGRLPLWVVEDDLAAGRLQPLNVTALGRRGRVELESYLAHRRDQPLGPAARALRASLLSLLQSK